MTREPQRQVFDCQLLDTLEARPWRPVGRQRHSDCNIVGVIVVDNSTHQQITWLPNIRIRESGGTTGKVAQKAGRDSGRALQAFF